MILFIDFTFSLRFFIFIFKYILKKLTMKI